jgi:hypothetical protein
LSFDYRLLPEDLCLNLDNDGMMNYADLRPCLGCGIGY